MAISGESLLILSLSEKNFPILLLAIALEVDPCGSVVVGNVVVAVLTEQKLRIVLGAGVIVTVEHCFKLPA